MPETAMPASTAAPAMNVRRSAMVAPASKKKGDLGKTETAPFS
jgi:hypothetical protein